MFPHLKRIDAGRLIRYRDLGAQSEYLDLRELAGLADVPFPIVVEECSHLPPHELAKICKGSSVNVSIYLDRYRVEYRKFLEENAGKTVTRSEIVAALRAADLSRTEFLDSKAGRRVIRQYRIKVL